MEVLSQGEEAVLEVVGNNRKSMIFKYYKSSLRKIDHILLLGSLLFLVATPIWEQVTGSVWLWSDIAIVLIISQAQKLK